MVEAEPEEGEAVDKAEDGIVNREDPQEEDHPVAQISKTATPRRRSISMSLK